MSVRQFRKPKHRRMGINAPWWGNENQVSRGYLAPTHIDHQLNISENTEGNDPEASKQPKLDQEEKPEEDADELREPSKQEIEESFKPENVINVETVRDKKRGVHKQIVEKKKEKSGLKDAESVKIYLNQWDSDRESWKFEKKKQVYIQTNCFDPSKILDEDWNTCLEYLKGSKGKSRDLLIETAEKLIGSLDQDGEMNPEATTKYNRSRDLLQMLN